jgi:hypothetical protein
VTSLCVSLKRGSVNVKALYEYHSGLVRLGRRGLSPLVVRDLATAGSAVVEQVAVLIAATEPPAPRSWLSRTALRVRVAFGADDPDQHRRDEVARFVEQFNRTANANARRGGL